MRCGKRSKKEVIPVSCHGFKLMGKEINDTLKMSQQTQLWACFATYCGHAWKEANVVSKMFGLHQSQVGKEVA